MFVASVLDRRNTTRPWLGGGGGSLTRSQRFVNFVTAFEHKIITSHQFWSPRPNTYLKYSFESVAKYK